ncbi:MAG TPA: TonB family protein [Terriglobales bacterium]|nr:TonB family protein [Terriglobales bacterium]
MIERVRVALRQRPVIGAAISLAFHLALVLALFWTPPGSGPKHKRGDALIVELPDPNDSALRGTPGPAADAVPAPAAPAAKEAPAPRPTPPARAAAPPRPAVAAKPTPKAEPREVPRAVATAPQPQGPAPRDQGDLPAPKPAPAQVPTPPAETAVAKADPAPAEPVRPQVPAPPAAVATPPSPPTPATGAPMPIPDIRHALRRGGGGGGSGAGGAGGIGTGRGGILGEPIPLDSKDPDFSDYLERVRQLIKRNWGYPCVKNPETKECEYKTARVVVAFGILKEGPLQFVEIRRASGLPIYDDYAVNAIKLGSPFPPVPAGMMARLPRGSTGIPIQVNFTYVVETGITNVIR